MAVPAISNHISFDVPTLICSQLSVSGSTKGHVPILLDPSSMSGDLNN